MENAIYMYENKVEIDLDALIVSMWNRYIEYNGGDNFISLNYDAAIPVALGGRWDWRDKFVFFDEGGYLTSFSHWDDERSPIDIVKIDVSHLIDVVERWQTKHDALQEG